MDWIITSLSVAGTILNIYKNRWGWVLWMIANAAWVVIDLKKGIPAQAVCFAFFFITAVWGWFQWSKEAKANHQKMIDEIILKDSPAKSRR